MFWNKYVLSCDNCRKEYEYKSKKEIKAFRDGCKGKCPECGTFLSIVPLVTFEIPPPIKSPPHDEVNNTESETIGKLKCMMQLLLDVTYGTEPHKYFYEFMKKDEFFREHFRT